MSETPEWDESPVTLSLVQELVNAHPEFRVTQHLASGGQRMMLIEQPDDNGDYVNGAPGDFVSFVSEMEDES